MGKLIWAICIVVLIPCVLSAQSANEHRTQGYAFVAPGGISGEDGVTLHIGAGIDARIHKGLSFSGEAGWLSEASSLRNGAGIISPGVSYHFASASKSGKFVPFVTGGYSLIIPGGALHGVHYGGGMTYWFKDRIGMRVEFRDHVPTEYPSYHFWGVRFGISFR